MPFAKKVNRTYLACQTCMKLQGKLTVHLRKTCKKTASESEIIQAVEKAKENRQKIVDTLSIVSYEALNFTKSRFTDPQEFFADFLERHGCIIANKSPEREPSDEEDESENTDDEEDQISLRKKLAELGIRKKHDLDSPMLNSFRRYLKDDFSESCIRTMVDSVARYLHFMNPGGISLDFLNDLEKTKEFLSIYLSCKRSQSTVKNYLNHIQHFVKFVVSEEFPNGIEEETRNSAETFLAGLNKINEDRRQKAKKAKKRGFQQKHLTPNDCHKVLTIAKPYIKNIFTRAKSGSEVDLKEKILACYYLETLLILKHLCKPSVPQNLMIKDWLERKYYTYRDGDFTMKVAVLRTPQTIVMLQHEEEMIFKIYFKYIRPTLLLKDAKTVDHFFVSSVGQAINNPSKDLARFHTKFQQRAVTGKETRDAFQKWAMSSLSKEDRDTVNCHMRYIDLKEEVDMDVMIKATLIMSNVKVVNEEESSSSSAGKKRKRTEEREEEDENNEDVEGKVITEELMELKEESFIKLLRKRPVGLKRPIPTLDMCKRISQSHARYCQDKWRRTQYKNRIYDVIDHFRNVPSKNEVSRYIKKRCWDTNVPRSRDIVEAWRLHESQRMQDDQQYLETMVESQEWRGLVIVEDPRNGGFSLKTTQVFNKGDIICDYHGVLMREKEIKKTLIDDMCYILFFHEKGEKMCLNAAQAPCECHPHMSSTFGRIINHSRKQGNVKTVLKYVQDGKIPVILFEAIKHLSPGTELLFSYDEK